MKKGLWLLICGLLIATPSMITAEEITDGIEDEIVFDEISSINENENEQLPETNKAEDITDEVLESVLPEMVQDELPMAEVAGDTIDNAVNVSFGQTYNKSWNYDTQRTNYYCKVIIPQQGILSIKATKPLDEYNDYISLDFSLRDENEDLVWGNHSFNEVRSGKRNYLLNVGLSKGVYYLNIKPYLASFYSSQTSTTSFSLSFTPSEYAEIEPNEKIGQATPIKLGSVYKGFYGGDGLDNM